MSEVLATGTLYIVATPIGNRQDISFRALKLLQEVDFILAEDTRHSKVLLAALGIHNKLSSLHAFNEHEKSEAVIARLCAGESAALISDAGTPLICDPGLPLLQLAREKGVAVIPIPGPCALITALSASGIACDSFSFGGFLPAKQSARLERLAQFKTFAHTLIFYESTHRLLACLDDIEALYGSSYSFLLAKELTKAYEHFHFGTVIEIRSWLLEDPARQKGEFVLILPAQPVPPELSMEEEWLRILLEELPLKQAVSLLLKMSKLSKNELYKLALAIKAS